MKTKLLLWYMPLGLLYIFSIKGAEAFFNTQTSDPQELATNVHRSSLKTPGSSPRASRNIRFAPEPTTTSLHSARVQETTKRQKAAREQLQFQARSLKDYKSSEPEKTLEEQAGIRAVLFMKLAEAKIISSEEKFNALLMKLWQNYDHEMKAIVSHTIEKIFPGGSRLISINRQIKLAKDAGIFNPDAFQGYIKNYLEDNDYSFPPRP